jgi:hypothetical protein
MDEKHLGWKGLWMENSNSNPSRQEGRDEKLLEWRIPLLIHIVDDNQCHFILHCHGHGCKDIWMNVLG